MCAATGQHSIDTVAFWRRTRSPASDCTAAAEASQSPQDRKHTIHTVGHTRHANESRHWIRQNRQRRLLIEQRPALRLHVVTHSVHDQQGMLAHYRWAVRLRLNL